MSAQTKFRFLAAPMAVSVVAPMIAPVIVRAILLAALASGLTMAGQAAASESEAKAWIKKMGKALRSENYEGVFTYMRGTTSEAMRIVHLAQDGNETERLFNLNDEVLEVHRYNDQVNCLHPKRGVNPQEAFRHSPV
ncbi:MAG: sigma-E factor regulatory protein RseB domain-containing protein, partial [Pseudomonadales bacterium]